MIISQTPLRISLFGGGTDFRDFYKEHEGCVVSTAIDKYIFVIINEKFDDDIVINYSQKERVSSVSEIRHELVREAMIKTGVRKAIEITMVADIPSEGSGMGSSSSVIVGLLNALYAFRGIQVTAEQLAREACDIEINILKKPIGKQDQYIAAYGGLCEIIFRKDESVTVNRIEMSDYNKRLLNSNLHLFYTGITRKSSDILTEQKQHIHVHADQLLTMKSFVHEAKELLLKNDFDQIGRLLNTSWEVKKSLSSNISNTFIDEMYQKAMASGALGGKILGAGGGGFLLAYCRGEHVEKLKKSFSEYREMPIIFERDGSKIIFNYRRYTWK
ncbi:MAG TPA: GHMP kinase [Bacteroidales bacterium]|nr:GHMP kinase [Bacteroidales bacterium]